MTDSGYERFENAMAAIDQVAKDTSASSRVLAAVLEMKGFVLTGATSAVRESIEAFGVQYNRLMQAAQESEGEEATSLSEPEAAELATTLRTTCELIGSTESVRVLSRLREHHGRLPEVEIDLIRKFRDWFVPLLL